MASRLALSAGAGAPAAVPAVAGYVAGDVTTDPCGVRVVVTGSRTWRDCGALVTRVYARYDDGGTTSFFSQRHGVAA